MQQPYRHEVPFEERASPVELFSGISVLCATTYAWIDYAVRTCRTLLFFVA
jgi:hypothetical protein